MSSRWSTNGKHAAVSIPFDNLGEPSDIEFGPWPKDRASGSRHGAARDLPAIRGLDTKVTLFFEVGNLCQLWRGRSLNATVRQGLSASSNAGRPRSPATVVLQGPQARRSVITGGAGRRAIRRPNAGWSKT